ncbi:MAG TPA: sensor domain-containing protein, partial [Actinomycetes bacterium]
EETLSALRVDIDRVGLPDSGSIRRRGDQRTRHQVIGTTLAALAVVAGAIGVTANLAGDDRSLQGPPAEQPSVSTTQQPLLTLADDPLLRPDDIGTIGVYEGWELNASPDAADQMLSLCVSKPSDLGGTDTVSGLYYNVLDGTFTEHVLRFPDAAAAQDALDTVAKSLTGCTVGTPADNVQTRWAPLDVTGADAAVHVSRSSETPNSEPSYLELGMARTSNVVVLLSWNSMGQPESVSWVWTADRLQTALDRAVG